MKLNEVRGVADQGAPEAQYVMGVCYENGLGFRKDKVAAETWYAKAALRGFAAAQYSLSLIVMDKGDERLAESVDWLQKSARQGFAPAQYLYSLYCEGGIGLAPDPAEAFRFNRLAADQGYCRAARRAASMFEQGVGVAVDLEQAFQWYCRAAELGDADSAGIVGRMYAAGTGVEKNDAKAMEWLREGERRGSASALFRLSHILRFGELGQPVDRKRADELAKRSLKFIKIRAQQTRKKRRDPDSVQRRD